MHTISCRIKVHGRASPRSPFSPPPETGNFQGFNCMIRTYLTLLAVLAAVSPAAAQSLQVTATVGGASSALTSGGTLSVSSTGIGQPVLAPVTLRNAGSSNITVTGVAVSGNSEMTVLLP